MQESNIIEFDEPLHSCFNILSRQILSFSKCYNKKLNFEEKQEIGNIIITLERLASHNLLQGVVNASR